MTGYKAAPLGRASSEWFDLDAKYGSLNLLIAQLTHGQHSLNAERYWIRVKELRELGHKI